MEKIEINLTIEEIKKKIVSILREAGVIKSAVFGSAARGELTDESDIDILVEFKEPVGFFLFAICRINLAMFWERRLIF